MFGILQDLAFLLKLATITGLNDNLDKTTKMMMMSLLDSDVLMMI